LFSLKLTEKEFRGKRLANASKIFIENWIINLLGKLKWSPI